MDTTLSALGVGRSGRAALWHLGLACAAGGAVLEALTIAAPCAATEWLEDDDDSNASARAGTAIVIGQIIGAIGWAVAADFLGRREAIVLACVGATGTCAVAACASTPFAFEVHWRRPRPSTRHHAQNEYPRRSASRYARPARRASLFRRSYSQWNGRQSLRARATRRRSQLLSQLDLH
jgi:hypothetical protein